MKKICVDRNLLKQKSGEVSFKEAKKIIVELEATLSRVGRRGLALSAPQIEVFKRVSYINFNGRKLTLINPVILERSEKTWDIVEMCLSLPHVNIKITRPWEVKVKYTDYKGDEKIEKFDEWLGRIIQHEIDHLDGKLIIDYIKKEEKQVCNPETEK